MMVGAHNRESPAEHLQSKFHNILRQEKVPAGPQEAGVKKLVFAAPGAFAGPRVLQQELASLEVEAARRYHSEDNKLPQTEAAFRILNNSAFHLPERQMLADIIEASML
jgi:hypothetical protein